VEGRPGWVAELAVAVDRRAGARLVLLLDRRLGLAQKLGRVGRPNLFKRVGPRVGLPFQEVAAALDAVARHLVAAQDQADRAVAGVADAGDVPPGVGRVAGVNPDRVA